MKISRRDILKLAAGSAAGILMTPVPWKVLDDSAIWTQNWPWIPVPAKGEPSVRFTTCSICPAGCGVQARCISGQPVNLTGVSGHPFGAATLCPVGLGGHHLAYHPARATRPIRLVRNAGSLESQPIPLDEAIQSVAREISGAAPGESVAILDQQPGRAISWFYQNLASRLPGGVYVTAPGVEDGTLAACGRMAGMQEERMGFDLEHVRTIVSFGAPLFEGWGTPGRMQRLADKRRSQGRPAVIQIETRQSCTALLADSWIPVQPGMEGVLALGLAHLLVRENLCDLQRLRSRAIDSEGQQQDRLTHVLAQFPPERVSAITGVSTERLLSLAHTMATDTPTVVLGAGDPAGGPLRDEENSAIAALNFLLGSVGSQGGIVARREHPAWPEGEARSLPVRQVQDLPDRSVRVLILDGAENGYAIPWKLLERKLADERAIVVSLSPYIAGLARQAGIIIPSPAFLESWQDVPSPSTSATNAFALAAPLITPPADVVEPLHFVNRLGSALGIRVDGSDVPYADHLKAGVEKIYAAGQGSVFLPSQGSTTVLKDMDSPGTLWQALVDGGCWQDEIPDQVTPSRISFFGNAGVGAEQLIALAEADRPAERSLAVMPYGWRGSAGSGQVSPLMSKLYQESGLRGLSNYARINPETGEAFGLTDDAMAAFETPAGQLQVLVRFDMSVMPGVLHVALGPDAVAINDGKAIGTPDLLSTCLAGDGRSWRVARAVSKNRTV